MSRPPDATYWQDSAHMSIVQVYIIPGRSNWISFFFGTLSGALGLLAILMRDPELATLCAAFSWAACFLTDFLSNFKCH